MFDTKKLSVFEASSGIFLLVLGKKSHTTELRCNSNFAFTTPVGIRSRRRRLSLFYPTHVIRAGETPSVDNQWFELKFRNCEAVQGGELPILSPYNRLICLLQLPFAAETKNLNGTQVVDSYCCWEC